MSELTAEQAAAIIEWSRDADGKMKIKLADKHRPLAGIGKHLGMWPNRVDATIKDATPPLTLEDRADAGKRLTFLLAVAAHEQEKEVAVQADAGSMESPTPGICPPPKALPELSAIAESVFDSRG